MIYSLNQSIDLGSNILGLFSTKEKAEAAKAIHKEWYLDKYNRIPRDTDIFIEEYELDQLVLWFATNKTILEF